MQTLLPYPHSAKSVRVLDMQRLGKQRAETLQILNVPTGIQTLNVYGYRDTARKRHAAILDENGERQYDRKAKLITEPKPVIFKYDRPKKLGSVPHCPFLGQSSHDPHGGKFTLTAPYGTV